MGPTLESQVLREARSAGIRVGKPLSTKTVRSRRRQLYVLIGLVATGVAVSMSQLVAVPDSAAIVAGSTTRTAAILGILIVAFSIYCIEKEVHLRRLEQLLAEERTYSAEVTGRLAEITSLLDAGRAVNSALDLREVLDAVLTNALALFEGARGSVSLVDGADELACVSAIGNPQAVGTRTKFGEGISGQVARTRQAVLVEGRASAERFPGVVPRGRDGDYAMSVPLIHRERLLGVLNVSSHGDRSFDDYDLRLLCLFAEHATSGIVHARMHEEDGRRVDALVKLEQSKTEFIAGVSHDLRTPLTSIVGCTTMARRPDVTENQRNELLVIAEAQSRRLAAMVERLLLTAELGNQAPTATVVPLDVVEVMRASVQRYADAGRTVVISGETAPTLALADSALLSEAIGHLADNALLHGAPPVHLSVVVRDGRVAVAVSDCGPGIPEDDRERIFERFVRLDTSRTTPGIGLGLPLARALVGAMGGTLVAEAPEAGGPAGARFAILLPAAVHPAASSDGDMMIPAQATSSEGSPALRLVRPA
ncbi:MAG TPA: ATP-binding protein [Mycobacteriales bacterium]|nr:ATP-binding protein [Mycobacteriales bacterium]